MRYPHRRTRRVIGVLAAFAAVTLVAAGCSDETEGPETGVDVEDVTEEGFSQDEFLDDPGKYIGEEVTVSAEISEVLSQDSFVIAGGDVPDLVVVSGQAAPEEIAIGTTVKVTGIVEELVMADIEREYNLDLERDVYVDHEDEHFIIASSIEVLEPAGE